MLKSRIIPCLLMSEGNLVKTQKFQNPKYIGDPLNAVRIFNEKKADELMLIDISATKNGTEPDFDLIEKIAYECRMPFCYGGGIKNLSHIKDLISLGVEKVSISSSAIKNFSLIADASKVVGNQSIVLVLDIKKHWLKRKFEIFTHNGTKKTGLTLDKFLDDIKQLEIGELVINSIANDGMMLGMDEELINLVYKKVTIPTTFIGGIGSQEDIKSIINSYGIIGVGVGSLFVFKGKYRAVLINYPNKTEKEKIYS